MKLSEYARRIGVKRHTAYRWFKRGEIPNAVQLPSGTIYVPDEIFETDMKSKQGLTLVYARVSSSEQRKTNLETQAERLTQFAIANGWVVDKVIKEVGSGLNDERKKLRFGYHYLEKICDFHDVSIVVVFDETENKSQSEELAEDITTLIHSFSGELYGLRHKIKKEIQSE